MNKSAVLKAWQGHSKCLHCNVRKFALFADLNQKDFDLIHQPITEFDYDASEVIYFMTDTPDYVYTIRSGLVKLVHDLANGTYRIVRILKQGDVAGIEALNGTAYLQNAVTLLPTSVCRIPVTEIERLNRESPRMTKQLTARWYQAVSDADIWLSELTSGHSRRRIASFLLHLDDTKHAEQFYIPTREDIGAILGITTETASRIIAEFRRNGWINIEGSKASISRTPLQELVLSY